MCNILRYLSGLPDNCGVEQLTELPASLQYLLSRKASLIKAQREMSAVRQVFISLQGKVSPHPSGDGKEKTARQAYNTLGETLLDL